ncbi:MAG: hypothetical protein ACOC1X_03970 [Promethearchaeota archaeon]
MGKLYGLIPETIHGAVGLIAGVAGCVLAATQYAFDWAGITRADKALFSFLVIVLIALAIGGTYTGNLIVSERLRNKSANLIMIKIFISIVGGVFILIMVINGACMSMSVDYQTYVQQRFGFLTGWKMLTSVTAEDVSSLEQFGLGIKQIVRALFLAVPGLIGTWGGLSVLTADSIDEAEGGILAIVASFVVFFVVWIFKAIGVSLMQLIILAEMNLGTQSLYLLTIV